MAASTAPSTTAADFALLPTVVAAVRAAGVALLGLYTAAARPADRTDIFTAARRNEDLSVGVLRGLLADARPQTEWVGDDQETTPLPPGEWWAVDAVEGNVNHIHGLPEWCVSVTLLRDNLPVLTAVHQPVGGLTYTAVQGGGARLNGEPLHASDKIDLADAIVTTGQAEAGQDGTYRRLGDSIVAMLGRVSCGAGHGSVHLSSSQCCCRSFRRFLAVRNGAVRGRCRCFAGHRSGRRGH